MKELRTDSGSLAIMMVYVEGMVCSLMCRSAALGRCMLVDLMF